MESLDGAPIINKLPSSMSPTRDGDGAYKTAEGSRPNLVIPVFRLVIDQSVFTGLLELGTLKSLSTIVGTWIFAQRSGAVECGCSNDLPHGVWHGSGRFWRSSLL